MKVVVVGLAVGAILMSRAIVAQADPVTVTSGSISTDFTGAVIELTTISFSTTLDGFGRFDMPANRAGFHVGDVVDFSSTVNFPMSNIGGFTPTVINGVTYNNAFDVVAQTNLQLHAAPVLITASSNPSSAYDVTTPFSMTGSIAFFRNAGTGSSGPAGNSLLTADVVGSGTLDVRGSGSGTLGVDAATFTFAETPAATPEPTTLLLLGTGAVGVLWRRMRRAPKHQESAI